MELTVSVQGWFVKTSQRYSSTLLC